MLDYKNLLEQLEAYLVERYPGVTVHTDIFEHAFLRLLDYPLVPEKCQFLDLSTHLMIFLRTPYQIAISDFIAGLKICINNGFPSIHCVELDPKLSESKFCARLSITYALLETHLSEIFEHINKILSDPLRLDFYRYWDKYTKKYKCSLTMVHIERLINEKLIYYPVVNLVELWNAIIKKQLALDKEVELTFLEQKIAIDREGFPKISLSYRMQDAAPKALILTRDSVVAALYDEDLNPFLSYNKEFLIPKDIKQFIKQHYAGQFFYVNDERYYEIDLGYSGTERKLLEQFGVTALSSHLPVGSAPEGARYYVYSLDDYLESLLVLKEIKKQSCFAERLHQLMYYIRHEKWEALSQKLSLLLNLADKIATEIDYTDLGLRLFDYAKTTLVGTVQEKTLEILFEVFADLVDKESPLLNAVQKKWHRVLFEISLMQMNSFSEEANKDEKTVLLQRLFLHSTQAGLAVESNRYLAELANLGLNISFQQDVCQKPLEVLIELASRHKQMYESLGWAHKRIASLIEENACLLKENAQLKKTNAPQEDSTRQDPTPHCALFQK